MCCPSLGDAFLQCGEGESQRIPEYPELEGAHEDHHSPAPGPAQDPEEAHRWLFPAPPALAGTLGLVPCPLAACRALCIDNEAAEVHFLGREMQLGSL